MQMIEEEIKRSDTPRFSYQLNGQKLIDMVQQQIAKQVHDDPESAASN